MGERGEGPDWSELESDPKFQEELLLAMKITLLEKRFGEEFFWEHDHLSFRKALENESGEVKEPTTNEEVLEAARQADLNPLLPEVDEFARLVFATRSMKDLYGFAKMQDIELTADDINKAKKLAIEGLANRDE